MDRVYINPKIGMKHNLETNEVSFHDHGIIVDLQRETIVGFQDHLIALGLLLKSQMQDKIKES